MTILEYLATPADLYAKALEVGHEWDEATREANEALNRAAEAKPKEPRKR